MTPSMLIADLRDKLQDATHGRWNVPDGLPALVEDGSSSRRTICGCSNGPKARGEQDALLIAASHNSLNALLDIAEAAIGFYCIECGDTGKVRDPMAWNDKPEDYHDCSNCTKLRAAINKLTEAAK